MIIMPRTGLFSARSASRTIAWYQSGKVERLPVIRLTLSARCMGASFERLTYRPRATRATLGARLSSGFAVGRGRVGDAEVLRAHPVVAADEPVGRQAALQQLADGGGAAGHSAVETPVVEDAQLPVGQHDLQPFVSI